MSRLSLLLLLALAASCGSAAPPKETEAPLPRTPADITMTAAQIEHGGVKWAAVVATTVADFVEVAGKLVVDDDRTARLSPSAPGRVTAVRANIGDRVTKGQILVTLQSEDAAAHNAELVSANADLTERQAALGFARAARERAERLLAMKAGSAQDVERARADEAGAVAGVTQAQSAVAHARSSLTLLAADANGQMALASPISGIVVARDAVVGSVVEAGASTLVVTDPSSLWLEFGASDDLATKLRPGQQVSFVTPAGTVRADARVLRVSGVLDPATRLVIVRAAVANAAGRLRPEMFATVRATTAAPRPGITVAHDAIQMIDAKPAVFVSQPDGKGGAKFIRREVVTGATSDGLTYIISGVTAGDIVVTDGAFAVKSMFTRAKMPAGE